MKKSFTLSIDVCIESIRKFQSKGTNTSDNEADAESGRELESPTDSEKLVVLLFVTQVVVNLPLKFFWLVTDQDPVADNWRAERDIEQEETLEKLLDRDGGGKDVDVASKFAKE